MRFSAPSARSAGRWLAAIAAAVCVTFLFLPLRVPAPPLFAGLLVGLIVSLAGRWPLTLARPVGHASHAVVGVAIGQVITLDVLHTVAADAPAVTAALVSTLVLSVGGGFALAALTQIDRPTGVFGMIAGGASGVIAISDEVGADAALVALMQYLRVLLVIASIPLVTGLLGGSSSDATIAEPAYPVWPGLIFCAAVAITGATIARLARLQSATLLGPMLLAAAVAIALPDLVQPMPPLVQNAAFLVIGLEVGLRFSLPQMRTAARTLPAILVAVIAIMLLAAPLLGWYIRRRRTPS